MSDTRPGRKRWRWFKREAIDLGDVVVQIFAVVIGILLALFINDWVTQRQQQANVNEAMRSIRAELAANRIELRKHAAFMFDMAKRMQDSPKNKDQSPRPCYRWDQWNGIGGLNLVDAAYETAIATQAMANMPFAEAQHVAQVYGWQHYLEKGLDFQIGLLMQSHPLDFCVGMVEEIGRDDLGLDKAYAPLIGADKAKLPKSPPQPAAY